MPRLNRLLSTARRQMPDSPLPQIFATPLEAGTEYSPIEDSADPSFTKIQVGSHVYVVSQEDLAQAIESRFATNRRAGE